MKNAALLLESVEYDRCLRRTASHGLKNPCHKRHTMEVETSSKANGPAIVARP